MSNVINASHLTLAYDNGSVEIIKDANFSIKKGEFVFITGPSGSGKSTLLKALYGQIEPNEGSLIVGGRDLATIGQGKRGSNVPKIDTWNELSWPPEWPLPTYEMSFLLPHLLADTKWQEKWTKKGMNVPKKLSVWIPRMYNPVWINPDGFRWIDTIKDESKMELTFNLSPTWSETNWYCDYILPVGLAGERHDQHSEATMPARWLSFRQPALRVALENMGWKYSVNLNKGLVKTYKWYLEN